MQLTKEEIVEQIKGLADSKKCINLRGINLQDYYIDLSGLEADEIYNNRQKAKYISNYYQQAKHINNNGQEANNIDNRNQIIVKSPDEIWNSLTEKQKKE